MGLIGSFFRLALSIVIFIAVLVLGIIYAPQLTQVFGGTVPPGSLTVPLGSTTLVIPILVSIVASVLFSLVLNLVSLPFRRAS